MSREAFIESFVANFLASWVAGEYNMACAHGHHERLSNPPAEDALGLAEDAWARLQALAPSPTIEDILSIRLAMTAEGWMSEDRITDMGWGHGVIGYSIWFERWDWHGNRAMALTGNKACFHAHCGSIEPAAMLDTTRKAAALARRAWVEFPDAPPVQLVDGTLGKDPLREQQDDQEHAEP
jgi:hypothetical protein